MKAVDILTPEERNADYYCPGCRCVFRYRAQSSNNKPPHFFRPRSQEHEPTCWMPTGAGVSGEIFDYDFSGFSAQGLLDSIKNSGSHNAANRLTERVERGENGLHRIKPTTIRQLFRICCENPDDTVLPDGTKILDLLCSRKTAYFYTKYCSGIKLVEARFYRYDSKKRMIYFSFPYTREKKRNPAFWVVVEIALHLDFYKIIKALYNQRNPVLLFSDWSCFGERIFTVVDNQKQIVPLK